MDFNIDLNLVQSQKVLLTPQLKQAIEILKMNSQELFEYVEEQIEANPVLEIAENEECLDESDIPIVEGQFTWEGSTGAEKEFKEQDDENIDDICSYTVDRPVIKLSLKEHLLFQLHTSDLSRDQILIGEYLINNTNENGYLITSLFEAAAFFNIPINKADKVLKRVQTFDPPGICARNLKECLLIQLSQMNNTDENVIKIVENYLDDLASSKFCEVAKNLGLCSEDVMKIYNTIKALEPKPGREFYDTESVKFIIPDVMVKKIKNKNEVLINEDSIPLVNINNYYRNIAIEDVNSETRKFLQGWIDSAIWLIKCIELRKDITRKVVECIVSIQSEFFEKGKKYIKPLLVKTVAQETGIHESIIGRIVIGKYVQCTWGIFEMSYFFT